MGFSWIQKASYEPPSSVYEITLYFLPWTGDPVQFQHALHDAHAAVKLAPMPVVERLNR